jgi:hypothetical protein
LFIPEEIPALPASWETEWRDLTFEELAFEIMSLYVSRDEIPADDLKDIIQRSYSTFRHAERTPLVELEKDLHLLELFHGPTFAFKGSFPCLCCWIVLILFRCCPSTSWKHFRVLLDPHECWQNWQGPPSSDRCRVSNTAFSTILDHLADFSKCYLRRYWLRRYLRSAR